MKKIISVLLLLCMNASAFAGHYECNTTVNTVRNGNTITSTGTSNFGYKPSTADYVVGGVAAGLAVAGVGAFCYTNFSTKYATSNLTNEQYLIEQSIRRNNPSQAEQTPIKYNKDYSKI